MALILNDADIRDVLSMDATITAMEQALRQYSAGLVDQPIRSSLRFGPHDAYLGVMPSTLSEPASVGAKVVSVVHENTGRGLPSHLATIVLLDPETGALQAIVDGRFITEIRTAAVSAVATRHLAAPQVGLLAILGTGAQARSHLEALSRVRRIQEVQVWSPTPEHCRRFAVEMAPRLGIAIRPVDGPRTAVLGADLIALTTASPEPVLQNAWVRDGAHIVAVGAYLPDQREMDSDLMARARVFVDSRAGALAEAGDIIIPMSEGRFDASHIAGEIGEVIAGDIPGRTAPRQVTVFKSLGMAVEDVAAAALAYRNARDAGIGTLVAL